MGRVGGFITAAVLLTCVAACSTGTVAGSLAWSAPPATTEKPPPPSTPPPFTPVVSPATVTAACPFLGGAEVVQIIGGGAFGDLQGQELEPQPAGPGKAYGCQYSWGTLAVFAFPGNVPPAALLTDILKKCEEPAVAIPGVGEVGKYCLTAENKTFVFAGKRGHGQTRMAEVRMDRTRTDVYTSVAKLLADRL